ncbi:50S ribosomal protein L22 [bacterium BMS3Abin05]|nr:50S ribosomal protein L22 [bacterium BMS3Abin05]GBE28663.1 50S ribosomal protein L22 [bacterium BMS3Bbin03]HDL78525.1 50S ribosomal protein L22 [Bacteroidota bacterium]HDZ12422.1 50S ribosomal protein L22 [Bacteroidota bacterium]
MEAFALTKYVRMSPRKVRQAAELIRGKNVDEAINILTFTQKAASVPLEKTLRSAVANMVNNQEETVRIEPEELYVKEICINEGPTMRRFRAGSMGRVMPIRKRSSHIKIVVAEEKDKRKRK